METNSPGGHGGGATGGGAASNITQLGGNAISTGNGTTDAGTIRTTIATDVTMTIAGAVSATGAVTALAGSAIIGKVGIDQTTDGTTNAVHLVAGTAVAGKFGIDQTTPGTTNAVQAIPGTSGGLTKSRQQIPNSTTGVSVVAGAHQLYHWSGFNNSTVLAYAKLYDKATAPVVASDTPVWVGYLVAPAAGGGGGFVEDFPMGLPFTLGIAMVVTTGYGDTDATAPAANAYTVNLAYK